MSEFLDNSVGYWVSKLKNSMKRTMSTHLKVYGLTPEQRSILIILFDKGSMSQREIGELKSMEASNLTVTLRRLIDKEYIIKNDHPNDTRAYLIELTDKAKKICPELKNISSQISGTLLKNISSNELETTLKTIKKMIENIE